MNPSQTEILLRRVAFRQRTAALASRFYVFTLVLGGLYGAVLLVSRLTAIVPAVFDPITLGVPFAGALLLAILFSRRSDETQAARLVDQTENTHDLFLTATQLERSPGSYQPLVRAQAEQQAVRITPSKVLPYAGEQRAITVAVLFGLLFGGIVYLPQLDPFGKEQARQEVAQRKERLKDTRKDTKKRQTLLAKKETQAQNSKQVKAAVDKLKKTFNSMKPGKNAQKNNLKRLTADQLKLAKLWRNASAKSLKNSLQNAPTSQRFGLQQQAKIAKLRKSLQKGDAKPLKKELDELKKMAKKLAKTKDPAEAQKLRKQLKKKLKALAKSLPGDDSSAMKKALSRAMDQLQMSEDLKLSQEALKGLEETLKLTKKEIEQLAQMVRDKKKLEDALKTLQMAKELNKLEGLDGEEMKGDKSLEEYEKLYKKMLAELGGPGAPGGAGGPGRGLRHKGAKMDENEKTKSDFKTEKSKTALQAGKILLKWRSDKKQVSKSGAVIKDYRRNIEKVKQGVSEAILTEQVPPGYHDSIKKYFDRIDEKALPPK